MAPSAVHTDLALRQRTQVETEALLAYINETLELPHPPVFLKATLPVLQRAMLEQFHENHLETMLTADVAPSARLRKGMTHNTIFTQLHAANADSARGTQMIARMMEDVKRIHFDGIHTLKLVFNSQRVAHLYQGLGFRLNGTCIELEDTEEEQAVGMYRPARLKRQYAVRVYGADDIGLVVLLAALGRLPGVTIVDAERSRIDSTEVVDNRYHLLRFNDEQCPEALRGITKLDMHGYLVTLHHHVIHQRPPCARCYAPYHTTRFCKVVQHQLVRMQAKFKRTYSGPIPTYEVGTAIQYRHTDGDSLMSFLDTLHQDLTMSLKPTDKRAETVVEVASLVATGLEGTEQREELQQTTRTSTGVGTQPETTEFNELSSQPAADGFMVYTRKSSRTQTPAQVQKAEETSMVTDAGAGGKKPKSHGSAK
ncbi:hypothetical protein PF008_g16065 [Phytophthora fragariae]|uniref:Uncharacterized protein n=1 Tax=Phytophthora fragariae TaxID=53985 RepID=A0A6G0RC80_9STRA|nr:hypothetical protein PF008_g16065 [Phytophthora fragariae]